MAVVVSQTLPWDKDALALNDPERWKSLGSLIRPTIHAESAGKNSVILVDKAYVSSSSVHLVAIVSPRAFTEAFFARSGLTACVANAVGDEISADEILGCLGKCGIDASSGIVVVQQDTEQFMRTPKPNVAIVNVDEEVRIHHLLALFQATRMSFDSVGKMLYHFLELCSSAKSTFNTEKDGDKATMEHSIGRATFESATKSLGSDLAHALKGLQVFSSNPNYTYSIHYSDINGLSQLERHIIAHEIAKCSNASKVPYYITSWTISSDDSGPRGLALSLCVVPRSILKPQSSPPNALSDASAKRLPSKEPQNSSRISFADTVVRNILSRGCTALISAEPIITEYDTIVGDGDCGLTLKAGAEKVLSFTNSQDLSNFPQVLSALVDDLEVTMGGTSGALYCIFLSSLSQALQTSSSVREALDIALKHLLNFTRARKGDRTCLDTLIPFVEVFKETNDFIKALDAARKGTEETKNLQASLGRSAYLDDSATKGVPDPGAHGLYVLLGGLAGK